MTMFWIIAGLMAAGALLFVLPPLLRKRGRDAGISRGALNISIYRDQLRELDADLAAGTMSSGRYDEAKRDIERRLIEETQDAQGNTNSPAAQRGLRAAIATGLLAPLLAIGLYVVTGNPDGLSPEKRAPDGAAITAQQIAGMVDKLAARLKEKPDDAEGWVMLGRSYTVLGRHAEAVKAYEAAVQRLPDNAQLLADYAGAMAMAQGGQLLGEPETIIARALKIDPHQPKVLAIAGTAAFEKKDYASAVAMWEKLQKLVPADSEYARSLGAGIAEARARAKEAGIAPPPAAAAQVDAKASQVSGVVRLASALAARVAPGDTVFIFARAAEGPRMPLAILKKRAGDLPVMFLLDDTLAMSPAMKLSNATQVVVGARISKSGDAMPKSGDFEGYSAPLKVGVSGVAVIIDTEVR